MKGKPSGKFGKWEMEKLVTVATFIASSGILTNLTGYLSSLDMGKWGTIIMAAWNLLLAIIYLIAKDNRPGAAKVITSPTNIPVTVDDQAGMNP